MNVRWKQLLIKTIFWLAAEVLLGFLELDTLADYVEFIYEKNPIVLSCKSVDLSKQNCIG